MDFIYLYCPESRCASGNTITAFCTEDCPDGYGDGITVMLNEPYDLTCDGEEKSAYLSVYPDADIFLSCA